MGNGALGLLLSGCSSEVERFSCSKEIDGWVKENLLEIRKMNRKDWLNSSWVYSKAIYVAFTPEQKIDFWNEKFDELKELPWNDEELKHINLAKNFLNTHKEFFYSKSLSDDQNDILESFFYKWKLDAEKNLNWDMKVIKAIAATGHKVMNTKGNIIKLSEGSVSDLMVKKAEKNCKCNTGILSDFCGLGSYCVEDKCDADVEGCGWFLLQECNGICE